MRTINYITRTINSTTATLLTANVQTYELTEVKRVFGGYLEPKEVEKVASKGGILAEGIKLVCVKDVEHNSTLRGMVDYRFASLSTPLESTNRRNLVTKEMRTTEATIKYVDKDNTDLGVVENVFTFTGSVANEHLEKAFASLKLDNLVFISGYVSGHKTTLVGMDYETFEENSVELDPTTRLPIEL